MLTLVLLLAPLFLGFRRSKDLCCLDKNVSANILRRSVVLRVCLHKFISPENHFRKTNVLVPQLSSAVDKA